MGKIIEHDSETFKYKLRNRKPFISDSTVSTLRNPLKHQKTLIEAMRNSIKFDILYTDKLISSNLAKT